MPYAMPQPIRPFSLRQCAVAVLCLMFATQAVANDGPAPTQQKAAEVAPSEADGWQPGLAGSILSSRFAAQHKDVGEAAKYLDESLKRDPGNESLKQQAMRAHLVSGNTVEAVALARSLQAMSGKDPLVASLVMIDAVHKGKLDEAKLAIAVPADRGLFGIIRPAMQEWITIAGGGLKAPITMQATLDKSGFFAPFLHYHIALMNDVLGYSDIALTHYQKASSDAAVTPYRVVEALSNFYMRRGEEAKAQAVFDAYAKENPESSLIPDTLAQRDKDGKVIPLIGNPAEGLAELFFSTASILFGEEMTNESFIYLRLALALRPDLAPAQLMLASLYETNQEYSKAIALYDEIKPGSVFHKRALLRKALNAEAMGDVDDALAQLRTISDAYPKDETALITIGDIRREQKDYEAAIEAYGEAMSRIGTLRDTDWPLLYARGIAYERADMWNAAERDFQQALALEPNQPDVLNYLGYSWLMMGKNTTKAMDYIEVALSARPDDAHIVDSMGWAYYHTGHYAKSVEMLERAAEMMPQDTTVNDHLGDAYWQVGRKTEARYQWKRALSFKPEKPDEERIRAKLDEGLPMQATPMQKMGKNDATPVIGGAGEDEEKAIH